MERIIPQRGSISTIGATRLSGLTDGQLAALALLQTYVDQRRLVAILKSYGEPATPELTTQDKQHAAQILQGIAKDCEAGPVAAFLNAAIKGLEADLEPVSALRDALEAYAQQVSATKAKRGQR